MSSFKIRLLSDPLTPELKPPKSGLTPVNALFLTGRADLKLNNNVTLLFAYWGSLPRLLTNISQRLPMGHEQYMLGCMSCELVEKLALRCFLAVT